jgi:hypothetical protein
MIPLGPPVKCRHLNAEAVRIADEEVVASAALQTFDTGGPYRGSQPFGVEPVNPDAEVIDPSGLLALLQDDQPTAWQIESMIVRPLDSPRWWSSSGGVRFPSATRPIWQRGGGTGRNVTFPARQYAVNGERRSFALLRPIGDTSAQERVRDLVL